MDFAEVFKPFLNFSKFTGLMPLTIKNSRQKFRVYTKISDRICSSLLAFTPIIFCVALNFNWILPERKFDSDVATKKLWEFVLDYGLILPVIQIIHQLLDKNKFAKFIEDVMMFDENSRRMGFFVDHKKQLRNVKILIVSCLSVILYFVFKIVAGSFSIVQLHIPFTMSIGFQMFYIWFFSAQFFLTVMIVKSRLSLLNTFLDEVHVNTRHKMKSISMMYGKICDLINLVNTISSFNIIFSLANEFGISILSLYGGIYAIMCPNFEKFWVTIISKFYMQNFITFLLCAVAWAGSSIECEFDRTSKIIAIRMNSSNDYEINQDLAHLSIQLQNRNKKIGNVFFDIDWRLILAVSHEIFLMISLFH